MNKVANNNSWERKVIVIIEDESGIFESIKSDLTKSLGEEYEYVSWWVWEKEVLVVEDLVTLLQKADVVLCDYRLGRKSTLTIGNETVEIKNDNSPTWLESLMYAASIMHNNQSIGSNYQANIALQIVDLFSFPIIWISTAFDKWERDIIWKHQDLWIPWENMIGKKNREKIAERLKEIFESR